MFSQKNLKTTTIWVGLVNKAHIEIHEDNHSKKVSSNVAEDPTREVNNSLVVKA